MHGVRPPCKPSSSSTITLAALQCCQPLAQVNDASLHDVQAPPVLQGYRRGESTRGSDAAQRCSAAAAPPAAAGQAAVANVPAEAARRPAINQAADLNTILEERDACGVRATLSSVTFAHEACTTSC